MLNVNRIRLVATGAVFVVFVAAAIFSLNSLDSPAYWFPAFVAVAGALAAALSFGQDLRKTLAGGSAVDGEVTDLGATIGDGTDADDPHEQRRVRRRAFAWVIWLIALPLASLVVPFFYASLVWLVAVMRFAGKRSWLFSILSVVIFGVITNVLIVLLQIHVPPALLTGWG